MRFSTLRYRLLDILYRALVLVWLGGRYAWRAMGRIGGWLFAGVVMVGFTGGITAAFREIERAGQAACAPQRVQIYRDYWVSWSACSDDDAAMSTPAYTSRYLAMDDMLQLR